MVWVPGASVEMAPLLAFPPTRVTGEPTSLPSMLNWMVPVDVVLPEVGVTVAVRVTG